MSYPVASVLDFKKIVQPATIAVAANMSEALAASASQLQKSIAMISIASLEDAKQVQFVDDRLDSNAIIDAVNADNKAVNDAFRAGSSARSKGATPTALSREFSTLRKRGNYELAKLVGDTLHYAPQPWDPFVDRIRRIAELKEAISITTLVAAVIELGDHSSLQLSGFGFVFAEEIRSADTAVLRLPGVSYLRVERQKGNG